MANKKIYRMIINIISVHRLHVKSTPVSVVVNLFFYRPGKLSPACFSGSQGLIADGIHSLSDLIADFCGSDCQ